MQIKLENVTVGYEKNNILTGIDLEIKPGEIFAVLGPNGSGKTTLLKVLTGALNIRTGAVYLEMKELSKISRRELARHIAAVEQGIEPEFGFTVREIVELGRIPHKKPMRRNSNRDKEIIDKAMKQADVVKFEQRSIFALSSGERQRVWLAMALAQEPTILVLDEPTSHLDIHYQIETLNIIQSLARRNLTIIMSLHDLNLAGQYANRVALMKAGKIMAIGAPAKIFREQILQEVFEVPLKLIDTEEGLFFAVIPKK